MQATDRPSFGDQNNASPLAAEPLAIGTSALGETLGNVQASTRRRYRTHTPSPLPDLGPVW